VRSTKLSHTPPTIAETKTRLCLGIKKASIAQRASLSQSAPEIFE
jgi:hypothetical protein